MIVLILHYLFITACGSPAVTFGAKIMSESGRDTKALSVGFPTPDGSTWDSKDYIRTTGDINGDGYQDIIGFGKAGIYVLYNCRGFRFSDPYLWSTKFGMNDGYLTADDFPRMVGDVNGDGYADIVAISKTNVMVILSNNGNSQIPISFSTDPILIQSLKTQDQYPRLLGDVNGDSKADLVICGDTVYVALSNGNSFLTPTEWTTDFGVTAGWTSQETYPRFLSDMNNDGKSDIVGFFNDGLYVGYSDGASSFFYKSQISSHFGTNEGYASQTNYPRMIIGQGIYGFKDGLQRASNSFGSYYQETVFPGYSFIAGGGQGEWQSYWVAPRFIMDMNKDDVLDMVTISGSGNGIKIIGTYYYAYRGDSSNKQ